MAKTKEQKQEVVELLVSGLKENETTFFTDFTGVDVNSINALRRSVRETGGRYYVAKHSLVKLAFEDAGTQVDGAFIEGVNGLVLAGEDPVSAAKVLKTFKDDHDSFVIKGGMLGTTTLSEADVIQLANTPPKEELLAKMLGSVNAPITGFVSASAAIIRKFMYAVNAIAENKEE